MIRKPCLDIHTSIHKILYLYNCQMNCIHIPICTAIFTQKRTGHSNSICKNITIFLLRPIWKTPRTIRFMLKKILHHGFCRLFVFFFSGNLMQIDQCHATIQIVQIIYLTSSFYPSVIVFPKVFCDNGCFLRIFILHIIVNQAFRKQAIRPVNFIKRFLLVSHCYFNNPLQIISQSSLGII